jgi:hypothetical protein
VVALIDDEQVEAVADLRHVAVSALEGRDRHGGKLAKPVAVASDRDAEQLRDLRVPLLEEDPRRDEAEGAKPRPRDRGDGDPRLPRAGRKDDDAAPPGELPREESRFLVRSQLHGGARTRRLTGMGHLVRVRHAAARELRPDRAARARPGSKRPNAVVPDGAGKARETRRLCAGEEDRAAVEAEDRSLVAHGEQSYHRGLTSSERCRAL